jgi:hypothetical protein
VNNFQVDFCLAQVDTFLYVIIAHNQCHVMLQYFCTVKDISCAWLWAYCIWRNLYVGNKILLRWRVIQYNTTMELRSYWRVWARVSTVWLEQFSVSEYLIAIRCHVFWAAGVLNNFEFEFLTTWRRNTTFCIVTPYSRREADVSSPLLRLPPASAGFWLGLLFSLEDGGGMLPWNVGLSELSSVTAKNVPFMLINFHANYECIYTNILA